MIAEPVPLNSSTQTPGVSSPRPYSKSVQVTLNSDTVADREAIGNAPITGAGTASCPLEKTREAVLFGGCSAADLYEIAVGALSPDVVNPFRSFDVSGAACLVPIGDSCDIPSGMMQALAGAAAFPAPESAPIDLPPEAADAARYYADLERQGASYKVWQTWWKLVVSYGVRWQRRVLPMSVATAIGIILHMARAGYCYGTIRNVRWTISKAHRFSGVPDPTRDEAFGMYLKVIRKDLGTDALHRKKRLSLADLRRIGIRAREKGTLRSLQEWTTVDVDFFSVLRRENLVDLNIEHLGRSERGYEVHVQRGKNHQHSARDFFIGTIPKDPLLCPVATLDRWLAVLKIFGYTEGPLFRHVGRAGNLTNERLSSRTVTRAIQRYMHDLDGTSEGYAAQSLRRGFITQAILSGISREKIRRLTGHKLDSSLDPYFEPGELSMNLSRAVTYGAARDLSLRAVDGDQLVSAVWQGAYATP